MSAFRGRGSYWGPRPAGPSTSAASGWWSAAGQFLYKRDGAWPSADETDPNFSSVSLLLHMNGSNGSTTFTDSSSNAHTVTANGNAQISTAQSKFGGASAYFDGDGDHINAGSSASFAFGIGPFTVECFVRFAALPGFNMISGIVGTAPSLFFAGNDTWWLGINNISGENNLYLGRHGDTAINARTPWTPALNTWYHIAATRDASNVVRLFIDGVSQTVTSTNNWHLADLSRTGTLFAGVIATPYYFNGYIDELRITKGVARYTASFTARTAPFPDA